MGGASRPKAADWARGRHSSFGCHSIPEPCSNAEIVKASHNINELTNIMLDATIEQKRGGETVVKATDSIAEVARQNLQVPGHYSSHISHPRDVCGFQADRGLPGDSEHVGEAAEHGPAALETAEPTRVITVRLPKSLHESLRDEAYEHRTSMNKLCISKLLQFIDGQQVPPES